MANIIIKLIQLVLVLIILRFLLWKLFCYVKVRYNMYKMTKDKPGPRIVELLKYVVRVVKDPNEFLNVAIELSKKYFPTSFFWIGDTLYCVITDPEDLRIILNSPDALEKGYVYSYFTRLFGRGLFTAPLHLWKNTRKAASPFFNNKNLNDIAKIVCQRANDWVETDLKKIYEESATMDMYDVTKIFTFSLNMEIATGVQFKKESVDYLEELSKKGLNIGFSRSCKLHLHPEPIFKITAMAKTLTHLEGDFIKPIQEATVQKGLSEKHQDAVYYHYLIKQAERKHFLTTDQITDEVLTFINAGYDTVSTTISFLLLMLGTNQDIQRKVHEEVMDVLGHNNGVTPNYLPQFKYLDMAIKETLRIFPAGPVQVRHTYQDLNLKTCTVPSGTVIIIPTIQMQRDERIWPEPMKFDPERFLPEETQKRHPYSFIPFMAGPRDCPGKKLGMMMMKAVVSGIIRKYKIRAEIRPIESIRLKSAIILESVEGYKMTLELRK